MTKLKHLKEMQTIPLGKTITKQIESFLREPFKTLLIQQKEKTASKIFKTVLGKKGRTFFVNLIATLNLNCKKLLK